MMVRNRKGGMKVDDYVELTLSRAAIIIAFIPRGQGFDARDIRA